MGFNYRHSASIGLIGPSIGLACAVSRSRWKEFTASQTSNEQALFLGQKEWGSRHA